MVVFGGGNEGIVDELHVYNTGKCSTDCLDGQDVLFFILIIGQWKCSQIANTRNPRRFRDLFSNSFSSAASVVVLNLFSQ